ncbi:MAG: sugar phosphate nucleotidyltransferase [Armatimonadota bacterium]|nr:sugar phosphate nucleotidyltransferase [bacterium]MDW8320371.1 sugar phosphate nucleotidyltransferase [Armatimonadota bacterium]
MKAIRKAVITAAGRGTRQFPATRTLQKEMLPLVDRDGVTKPALQLLVEEAVNAGIEQVGIVVNPESEAGVRAYFGALTDEEASWDNDKQLLFEQAEHLQRLGERIVTIVQKEPLGLGHAVYLAREFVGEEPFVMYLGDHVLLSRGEKNCTQQVLDVYAQTSGTLSAVRRTPEERVTLYGTLSGTPLPNAANALHVHAMIEKPTVEQARASLRMSTLPDGVYYCFFGINIFTPEIFECLERTIVEGQRMKGEFQLTTAQQMLVERGSYYACEIQGEALDIGIPQGYLEAQVALGLAGTYGASLRQWMRERGGCSG